MKTATIKLIDGFWPDSCGQITLKNPIDVAYKYIEFDVNKITVTPTTVAQVVNG